VDRFRQYTRYYYGVLTHPHLLLFEPYELPLRLTFREWHAARTTAMANEEAPSSARMAGLPLLHRVEQPAVGNFTDQWKSFLIINATRLGGELRDNGDTTVRASIQWNLLKTCMAPGSPAQAWFRRHEATIRAQEDFLTVFWGRLEADAGSLTPAQITRFHKLSKKADESLADFGERFLTAWHAVADWVAEHQAVTQFLQAIKASPHLLHTVDALQEPEPGEGAEANAPRPNPRSLPNIIALAVNIMQQEALRTHSSFTPVAQPRAELTEQEVMAYLEKHKLTATPVAGGKSKGKAVKAEPTPDTSPPSGSTSSYWCDHHKRNTSHSTERCYQLNPELRPSGSSSRRAKDPAQGAAMHAMLTDLGARMEEFVNTLTAATNKPPLSAATHLGATLGDRQPGAVQQQGREALRGVRCSHCKKLGHTEATCWDKHPEQLPIQYQRPRPQQQPPPGYLPYPAPGAHTAYLALPAPQQLLALPAPPGPAPAATSYVPAPSPYAYSGQPVQYVYPAAAPAGPAHPAASL